MHIYECICNLGTNASELYEIHSRQHIYTALAKSKLQRSP